MRILERETSRQPRRGCANWSAPPKHSQTCGIPRGSCDSRRSHSRGAAALPIRRNADGSSAPAGAVSSQRSGPSQIHRERRADQLRGSGLRRERLIQEWALEDPVEQVRSGDRVCNAQARDEGLREALVQAQGHAEHGLVNEVEAVAERADGTERADRRGRREPLVPGPKEGEDEGDAAAEAELREEGEPVKVEDVLPAQPAERIERGCRDAESQVDGAPETGRAYTAE